MLNFLKTISQTFKTLLSGSVQTTSGSSTMSATPNGARVKLYSFSESHNWDEVGTGHVTLQYVDRLQGLSMIVRSEDDGRKPCVYLCAYNCGDLYTMSFYRINITGIKDLFKQNLSET